MLTVDKIYCPDCETLTMNKLEKFSVFECTECLLQIGFPSEDDIGTDVPVGTEDIDVDLAYWNEDLAAYVCRCQYVVWINNDIEEGLLCSNGCNEDCHPNGVQPVWRPEHLSHVAFSTTSTSSIRINLEA